MCLLLTTITNTVLQVVLIDGKALIVLQCVQTEELTSKWLFDLLEHIRGQFDEKSESHPYKSHESEFNKQTEGSGHINASTSCSFLIHVLITT